MKTYKCGVCKEFKESQFFFKDNHNKYRDLLDSRCKNCRRIDYREKRQRNLAMFFRKDKRYYISHLEEIKKRRKKWYLENKIKVSAHSKVKRAVYNGVLVRKPCEICGEIKSDAHHEDYSKPLVVRWLCRKHHIREHSPFK